MWEHPTTAYHEGVPGHHLQMGLLRVLPLVPRARVGINFGHAEGWALYAERLMDELGWFSTPAYPARVPQPAGLPRCPRGRRHRLAHWARWLDLRARRRPRCSRPVPPSRAFAQSEVLRYLSWPAQAPSYKLGERTWLRGRTQAMQSTGAAFDRKAWHAQALGLGPLGLDRLEHELAAIAALPA